MLYSNMWLTEPSTNLIVKHWVFQINSVTFLRAIKRIIYTNLFYMRLKKAAIIKVLYNALFSMLLRSRNKTTVYVPSVK